MSNYNQTLRANIQARIKTPADPRVSGAILQSILLGLCDAIDRGGTLIGLATTNTVPETAANGFYTANIAGTYSNFLDENGDPLVVLVGETALFKSVQTNNDGVRWQKELLSSATAPNGSVLYSIVQSLTPEEKSRALGNIGAAVADGENPDLVAGDIIPKSSSLVETDNVFNIQTTGGDIDLKSGGSLLEIIRGNLNGKLEPFVADTFVSTGMNLVNPEQSLTIDGRTAYYFPVAKGTWGSYGTTQENNGYIVVGDTPYSVCYSAVKPTASEYGTALSPVNSNGKKYYVTPNDGWLVVIMNSGSELPAVHVAWSNYNDEIGGVFGNITKDISPFVQWIHTWGMAALFGPEYAVFDEINITEQRCYRRIDRAALNSLDWTMTTVASSDEETQSTSYTYVFSAVISAMKSGGLYSHSYPGMEVSGNTVTIRSTEITTVPDFVISLGSSIMYYELATVVSRTFAQIGSTLTSSNVSDDFGLTYFLNNGEIADVPAYVTEAFRQGGKDQLFNAVTYQKILAEVLASAMCQINDRLNSLENREDGIFENLTVKRRASILGWREADNAPADASSLGTQGDYYIDADYLYVCIAQDNWKRTELSTF